MESFYLSVVVPVYNERENIRPFVQALGQVMAQAGIQKYELIFCLDPSPDGTREAILAERETNPHLKLILFSRRFGQPAATMAGIQHCHGDACVVMDVDRQDPVELIPSLVAKWQEGYDVVYAKRRSRAKEPLAKRAISWVAYQIIHHLADIEIPTNTGDFRLISRRVVHQLQKLNETHGYLRGMVAFVGFKQTSVAFDRPLRRAGKSKYSPFTGSFTIGFNGLFCFSSKPLGYLLGAGGILIAAGLAMAVWKLLGLAGLWAPFGTGAVWEVFSTGLQLAALGLVGQYIARIYDEVKKRPLYIIDEIWESEG